MASSVILDDSEQEQLLSLSNQDPDAFKSQVISLLNENRDKFDVLHLHQNEDATTISKESFLKRFEGTLNPDLLSAIFDVIDDDHSGNITNAAFLRFTNNKPKHPPKQATQIVECQPRRIEMNLIQSPCANYRFSLCFHLRAFV